MEELEQNLINTLNASPLSLEAKRYILKHLYNVVDLNYQLAIERQKLKQEEQPDEQVSHANNVGK